MEYENLIVQLMWGKKSQSKNIAPPAIKTIYVVIVNETVLTDMGTDKGIKRAEHIYIYKTLV